MNRFFILMMVATNVHAWGTPATATTTVQANIVGWTEDPCDFPEHQDKCVAAPIIEPKTSIDSMGASYNISPPEPIPNTPFVKYNSDYE